MIAKSKPLPRLSVAPRLHFINPDKYFYALGLNQSTAGTQLNMSAFQDYDHMHKQHSYKLTIKWTGNTGTGTDTYRSYERSYSILGEGKIEIAGSSDPHFRGDKTKYNPEDLLLASLSSCHMLTYLHLCAEAGVKVLDYYDHATGTMTENENGGGQFTGVMLNPVVIVADEQMIEKAIELHKPANKSCFISNSVNFKVSHNPVCKVVEFL